MNEIFILIFFAFSTADGKRVDGFVDFEPYKTRETCEAGAKFHRNKLAREYPNSLSGVECVPLNVTPKEPT
jgi:hypothetical protein